MTGFIISNLDFRTIRCKALAYESVAIHCLIACAYLVCPDGRKQSAGQRRARAGQGAVLRDNRPGAGSDDVRRPLRGGELGL